MNDLEQDPLWRDYEQISEEHNRAVVARREIERALRANFSDDRLRDWDAAHRAEEKCYEQVKAAERALWAKLHNA